MIKEFLFGLLGCATLLSIIFVSEKVDLKVLCENPVQVTVDKAHKPVYPVGTFEYEHKRTI